MLKRGKTAGLAAILALVVSALASPTAIAANSVVKLTNGQLSYTDTAGNTPNIVTVSLPAPETSYRLDDTGPGVVMSVTSPCTKSGSAALCPASQVSSVNVNVANATNEVTLDIAIPSTIAGGNGNDTFKGGSAKDVMFAGGGPTNQLFGRDGPDELYGGVGSEYMYLGHDTDHDVAYGYSGYDFFEWPQPGQPDTYPSTTPDGNDWIDGDAPGLGNGDGSNDWFSGYVRRSGLGGVRVWVDFFGLSGQLDSQGYQIEHDTVVDVDSFAGSGFNDQLIGGDLQQGQQRLYGLGGSDLMMGQAGADAYQCDAPLGVLSAGTPGNSDLVSYHDHSGPIKVTIGDGPVTGNGGNDGTYDPSTGLSTEHDALASDCDNVEGSSGNDWLIGDGGDNYLFGADGNDFLEGGDGNDRLGGPFNTNPSATRTTEYGNDVLIGWAGQDVLLGGPGSDISIGGEGDDASWDISPEADIFADGWNYGITVPSSGADAFVTLDGRSELVWCGFNDPPDTVIGDTGAVADQLFGC